MEQYPLYSVLMSVYKKENPEWMSLSFDSMIKQTIKPAEIVLVKDGPLTEELDRTIDEYIENYPGLFKVVPLPVNQGLGLALRRGVTECSHDYIARMDTDDYSVSTRIQEEFDAMFANNADMVGCVIDEFVGDPSNVVSHRALPENHKELVRFAKKRVPIAHPAVLFKRSKALECGNYDNYRNAQDYSFFVRMLMHGAIGYNIQKTLVYMRVTPDFYKRRSGKKFLSICLNMNMYFYRLGWFSIKDLVVRSSANIVFCVMPNTLRIFLYKKVLRKH